MFIKKILSLFKMNRKVIRSILTLLNALIFSIIIIVDIIAFFQGRDLELLIVLTLLTGSLVAYSQAWYFGSFNLKQEEPEIKLTSEIKPEVRFIEKPMTQAELDEVSSRELEED